MATSDTGNRLDASQGQIIRVSADKRIDTAHQAPASDAAGNAAVADKAAEYRNAKEAETAAQQWRMQATQLAEHLRARQKDLDHREAELNARSADLEGNLRSARLWLSEHMAEVQSRDAELQKGEADWQQRTADLQKREAELLKRNDELQRRDEQLRGCEAELHGRETALQQCDAELQQRIAQAGAEQTAREQSLQEAAYLLDKKQSQLTEAEASFIVQQAELAQMQEQLVARWKAMENEDHERYDRLEAERRRVMDELEKQRRTVQRRGEHVDRCRVSMEQLREELGRLHRETLEIRLATEELWVQLSGAAPPASLIQSLGRIRSKLADHYRLANVELHGEKEKLQKIHDQLLVQHESLVQQKRQFEQWAAARQDELEKQTSRLVAREQQVERREAELHESCCQFSS
jgi:hypothetical protein